MSYYILKPNTKYKRCNIDSIKNPVNIIPHNSTVIGGLLSCDWLKQSPLSNQSAKPSKSYSHVYILFTQWVFKSHDFLLRKRTVYLSSLSIVNSTYLCVCSMFIFQYLSKNVCSVVFHRNQSHLDLTLNTMLLPSEN